MAYFKIDSEVELEVTLRYKTNVAKLGHNYGIGEITIPYYCIYSGNIRNARNLARKQWRKLKWYVGILESNREEVIKKDRRKGHVVFYCADEEDMVPHIWCCKSYFCKLLYCQLKFSKQNKISVSSN
jgi:hypothetical protein